MTSTFDFDGETMTAAQFKTWAKDRKIELVEQIGEFKVGSLVDWTNDYGVHWQGHEIIGIAKENQMPSDLRGDRKVFLKKDAYWFPLSVSILKLSKKQKR